MTANIFISFASKDVKMAMTLCTALENRGYKCWISARDIQPGENFQVAIVQAIRHAKIMLLVFTANSNNSEEMTKELALASQQKMIVIPLRVEDVTPSDAFAYEFATRQWIDFFADWEFAIEQLARRIANALRDRNAGLENHDATEALTEVAAIAPVAYTPKAPEPRPPEPPPAPEPPRVETPKVDAKVEARIEAPKVADVAKAEPLKPTAPAKPIAHASALEVRQEVLAALKPGTPADKAPFPAAPLAGANAEPSKGAPVKPEPVKAKLAAAAIDGETKPGGGRRVAVLVGLAVLVLVGAGLLVPALLRGAKAPEPAPDVAPVQEPAVVAAPTPAPVDATALNAVATNAIAGQAAATNAVATNAPVAPRPARKKVEPKTTTPKDDIPF